MKSQLLGTQRKESIRCLCSEGRVGGGAGLPTGCWVSGMRDGKVTVTATDTGQKSAERHFPAAGITQAEKTGRSVASGTLSFPRWARVVDDRRKGENPRASEMLGGKGRACGRLCTRTHAHTGTCTCMLTGARMHRARRPVQGHRATGADWGTHCRPRLACDFPVPVTPSGQASRLSTAASSPTRPPETPRGPWGRSSVPVLGSGPAPPCVLWSGSRALQHLTLTAEHRPPVDPDGRPGHRRPRGAGSA